MITRIGGNAWYLFFELVQELLSVLFPVPEPKKPEVTWDVRLEPIDLDPLRPMGYFDSWAGNVQIKQQPAWANYNLGWSSEQVA